MFTESVTIKASRDTVTELFDNPDYLAKRQPELLAFEPIEGIPGQPGARLEMVMRLAGREIRVVQTVQRRNLPHEFGEIYEVAGVWHRQSSRFQVLGEHLTRWEVDCEFRFTGWLKYVAWLGIPYLRWQIRNALQKFRNFAEASGHSPG